MIHNQLQDNLQPSQSFTRHLQPFTIIHNQLQDDLQWVWQTITIAL
jgi:hypothetical protein